MILLESIPELTVTLLRYFFLLKKNLVNYEK